MGLTPVARCICHMHDQVRIEDQLVSGSIGLRQVIEGRPVVVGDNEHKLQLKTITEHPDGGAMVTIAIVGAAEQVQISVSDALLHDPIALRLRVVYFVKRMVSRKLTSYELSSPSYVD